MYLDSAYIIKLYLNEPESGEVRSLVRGAEELCSSAFAIAEVNCALLRRAREHRISEKQCEAVIDLFGRHIEEGVWHMAPVSSGLLAKTRTLAVTAPGLHLRAGDAIHLLTAQQLGEKEVWTGDRHMLAAAPYFNLTGRSV